MNTLRITMMYALNKTRRDAIRAKAHLGAAILVGALSMGCASTTQRPNVAPVIPDSSQAQTKAPTPYAERSVCDDPESLSGPMTDAARQKAMAGCCAATPFPSSLAKASLGSTAEVRLGYAAPSCSPVGVELESLREHSGNPSEQMHPVNGLMQMVW